MGSQLIPITEQQRYFPYQGGFRYIRNDFYGAGVDNFTQPPSQNQELFSQLSNVQPILSGPLQGRWGYAALGSAPVTGVSGGANLYSYQNDLISTRYLVACSPTTIFAFTEAGASWNSSIFTPTALCRMVSSRSTAFFASGNAADYLQWNGMASGGTNNWGISAANTTAAVATNALCGTGANVNLTGGPVTWVNPNNITTNSAYATMTAASIEQFNTIEASNFGFSIPTGVSIDGITATFVGKTDGTVAFDGIVYLIVNGGIVGSQNLSSNSFASSDTSVTIGSPSSTWGGSATPASINASNFGCAFWGAVTTPGTFSLKAVYITIYYGGAFTVTPGGASSGNITLTSGRTYFVAYQNGVTGDTSDIGNGTVSTGALTNQNVALSAIPVSNDSQVNNKILLATLDGNNTSTLYLLATISNSATTYTDNMPDSTLALQPIYQQVGSDGLLHGCAQSLPPPVGAILPTLHRGRMYLAQGSILWFSKAISDLTTSTGTVCGRPETSWPGNFQLDATKGAETIRALYSDGTSLYIGTEKHIRRLDGDFPNFSEPSIIFNNIGVTNQNTIQTVYKADSPIGATILTPDHRLFLTDFNTYQDIGIPIQTTLNTINDNYTQLMSSSQSYSLGAYDLMVLAIPTGLNTTADTLCVFDCRLGKWHIWNLYDKISAQLFNISAVAANIPQILFLNATGALYQIGPGAGGTDATHAITSVAKTSWLHFGDPSLIKLLNEMLILTDYTAGLTVTIEGANTEADFLSPTVILNAVNLAQQLFGDWKLAGLAGTKTKYRFYRFTFTIAGLTQGKNILQGINLEVIPFSRL